MTTKVKPSSPGQLQCQTLESPCWCPGCCSFQRPDFAAWIIRQSHYIWYIIYDIWFIIYSWQETWAINSSLGERLLPAAALAFSSQRRRLEQSSWSWEPKQYWCPWCLFELLTQPWRSCRSARRQDRTRWKHSRPLQRSSQQELWKGRRQSKKIFFMSLTAKRWHQLQLFSGLTSIKRASLFSLADSSVDLSSKD